MRRYGELSRGAERSSPRQFFPDCTIAMCGYDFRGGTVASPAIPRSCGGGPLNSATMMLPSGHSGRSCQVSSNYSKLGEFEIVRDVHDIQGGNGADASFRFLTINRHNVMSVGTNIEVNIRATYSVLIAREQSSKGNHSFRVHPTRRNSMRNKITNSMRDFGLNPQDIRRHIFGGI
jgi:hypothetical protein